MFPKHARFKTRSMDGVVPQQLQIALWEIIDRDLKKGRSLDYIQMFDLTIRHADGGTIQQIRHRQEHPKRNRLHILPNIESPVSGVTVWIIDSGSYCTLTLPEEY